MSILVTNVGVTLRQIVLAEEDRPLSISVREGAIAAVTGTSAEPEDPRRTEIHRVLELANARPEVLGMSETALLTEWLQRLSAADTAR